MAEEDLELVRRAVAGDEESMREVTARVQRVARGCLKDFAARVPAVRGHEQDLVQRLQVMLLENDRRVLKTFEGRASLQTWVRVIALRFFIRRAGRLPKETLVGDGELARVSDPAESADQQLERHSIAQRLRSMVSALDPEDQLLLALLFEQDLPAHEAGRVLGLTAFGVRMRKQRLLQKLSKRLKGAAEWNDP